MDTYLQPSNFLETDYLERNSVDYVGIYANTICYRDTLRMLYRLEYLRRMGRWKGKIIVGGPHTTVCLNSIPDFVDFVVQGEGEQAILDIVDGRVTERVVKYPRIKELDKLPMPAWDYFVNLPYNWGGEWFSEKPVFTMNTSRGCPFRCKFCSVGSIWGKRYTYFSAQRVVEEIEHLIEHYGAKGIYFREDNFTLNKKRLRRFCNLLLEKGIRISWACETRVNTLDREIVELMSRAGACGFYFGVESGSQRILDFLKKDITIEQTRNAFRLCHEFGIKTAASVVVGVPGETAAEVDKTLALLKDIKATVVWFNVFVGIPNSELYKYTIENRLYEFIDDRGLVYLKGHNERVKRFYGGRWDAAIPLNRSGTPIISVVMSVYNGGVHLKKAIKSILGQSFQDIEFIIVNDASNDNTAALVQSFDDSRIRVITNSENLGLTKSLIKGINAANGKYIARMDADDISLPHRFEMQVEFLERNLDHAVVGSSYYQIDDGGKICSFIDVLTDHMEIREGLKKQNWLGHGSVMMRKDAFLEVGGYDEKYKFAQDYDLWLRMAETHKISNIEEPLYCWRLTASCISKKKESEQRYYANLAISEARKREGRKMAGPMVSVIVPTHNRPEMLVEALKSILNQSYQNFEIIVVNDAGSDVGNRVTKLNQRKIITYIKHAENRGLATARNTGIKIARGKYIAYLDDDDIFYPDHLETLVKFLETKDYKVAYTDAYRAHQEKHNGKYVVTNREVRYSFDFDYDQILVHNFIPVLCLMHEKSCLDEVGLFDEHLKRCEDWDLLIRMSRKFKFKHIKKITCEFCWRPCGTTTMTSGRQAEFWKVFEIIYDKYKSYTNNNIRIAAAQRHVLAHHQVQRILELYNKEHRTDESIRQLEEVLINEPNIFEAHTALGMLYYKQGSRDKALLHFEQATEVENNNVTALKNLADLYLTFGRTEKAGEIYQKIDGLTLQSLEERLHEGEQRFQEGRFQEAEYIFRKVIKDHPKHAQSYNDLACILWQTGRVEEALQELKRAMEIAPANRDAIWNCGQIMVQLERPADALGIYQNFLKKYPNDLEIREAAENIKKRRKEDETMSDDAENLIGKGENFFEQGKVEEAITIFKNTLKIKPDLALVHNDIATVYHHKGKFEKAVEHITEALRLAPDNEDVIWNCGQILMESGFLKDGLKVYEDFLQKHPDNAELKETATDLKKRLMR